MKATVSLLAALVLGALWPPAASALVALVNKASFALLTLLPFGEPSNLSLADRITTAVASTALAGSLFGLALAALAGRHRAIVLFAFVVAAASSALVLWPLQGYDPSALNVFGETLSPAWWFGALVACGLPWALRNGSSKSKAVSVAAP